MIAAIQVREAARSQWQTVIFPALGIAVRPDHRHSPCPYCGGRDRFFCDNKNGSGSWFCRRCEVRAGDGFSLVMKMRGCSFPDALRLVAGVLGLDCSRPIDYAALARERTKREGERREADRQRELIGFRIDVCREAENIITAAAGIDISHWSNERLDDALNRLADAYATLEREGVAHG